MTAPDFRTSVTEVVSYGETAGFILTDITGLYNVTTNPGGWGEVAGGDPNLEPGDILYAMVIITPYEGDDIPILLEMSDTGDDLYWQKVLTHLAEEGITLDADVLGLATYPNGHWTFKSFYWAGYYAMPFTYDIVTNPGTGFSLGEIVQGASSGATGYLVYEDGTTAKHITWIQGTFENDEILTGLTSGATVTIGTVPSITGEIEVDEVYSYTNHQSILTETRNTVRKQPLDIMLPRINEKHALYVSMADLLLETLDDAVEVGQIENYNTIFDFTLELITRIDETYCID